MSKRQRDAREYARRIAALRRRAVARRRRMRRAYSALTVVAVAFAAMIVVKITSLGGAEAGSAVAQPTGLAATAVVAAATSVPVATLDAVGTGLASTLPKPTSGQPLLADGGKPVVLYVGAEYCPYCAAQRWPMVVALSRFGTFTGLGVTASAMDDVFANTATLSFHAGTYSSRYLAFQGVETSSNVRRGQGYAPLDTLTAQQQTVVHRYNAPPYVDADSAGAIPFIDFANQAVAAGASFSPQLLAGRSAQEIAAALAESNSEIGRAVDGNANAITALLCRLTGGQPEQVCTSPAVTAFGGRFDNVAAG